MYSKPRVCTARNWVAVGFTIRFGSSDTTDRNLMKEIASNKDGTEDHYFDAPSVYDIPDVFKQIGKHLGWRLL